MKNYDIYDKFNDIQTETEEFPLNDLERAKLRKTAKEFSKKTKKHNLGRRIATIAAALVLLVSIGNIGTGGVVWASAVKMATNIQVTLSEFMGLSSGAEEYIVKINEPIIIGEDEYVVNELAVHGEDLFMSMIAPSKVMEDLKSDLELSHIKLNGEKIKILGASGTTGILEENPNFSVSALKYSLEKPLPKEGIAKVELILKKFAGTKSKTSIVLELDMGKLESETKEIASDFLIPGTEGIKIETFIINPVVQMIELKYPESETSYMYFLEGVDQLGRKFEFDVRESDKEKAKLYFSPITSEISADELLKEVEEINFTLVRQELPKEGGKIDTPIENIGESFTIHIKK